MHSSYQGARSSRGYTVQHPPLMAARNDIWDGVQ